MRAVVVAAVLAGCGRIDFGALHDGAASDATPYDPNDGSHGGARLKLQWNQYEDGTRQLAGVFDSERSEVCTIEPWSDGVVRCTPLDAYPSNYADSACTMPEEVWPFPASTPPAYFYDAEMCGGGPANFYPIGTQVAPTTYYAGSGLGCLGPFAGALPTFTLPAEIPATSFAQITTSPAGAGRISLRTYSTSDGFSLQATLADSQLDIDCTVEAFNGELACLPHDFNEGTMFSDATCSTSIVNAIERCAAPPYLGYLDGECVEHLTTAGTVTTPPTLYDLQGGGGCVSAGAPDTSDFTYWSIGTDVSPAPLTSVVEAAPGHRLQRYHLVGDQGELRDDTRLYDSQLAIDCASQAASDGVTRCLPSGVQVGFSVTGVFTDAGCTNPIDLGGFFEVLCAPDPLALYVRVPASLGYEIHSIGALYSGPLYALSPTCVPYSQGAEQLYVMGSEIDPTTFAAATMVQDP